MTLGGPVSSIAAVVVFAGAAVPAAAPAQVVEGPADTTSVQIDSTDATSVARGAQARFERRRHDLLPVQLGGVASGPCDERVGRFCTWFGEGEWYPRPEDEEIVELRRELLHELDRVQKVLPGDGWILGQRVWYRAEGGDWQGALATARACGGVDAWWCAALEGFALHGMDRFVASERSFDRALASMTPARLEEWSLPLRAVDSDARSRLEDALVVSLDSARAVADRAWLLADPLLLVDGNDRRSAHYARWTVATIREEARNPFRIRWGRDLEELTIRHGWEIGWERIPRREPGAIDDIVGHKHPQGRDYMPPGRVLDEPSTATAVDLLADGRRPRSLYAPAYAPILLPMEGQLAVFPRGEETVLVSTHHLPEDTTFHAGHDHPLPWLEPGDQRGMDDRIGLFAIDALGVVRGVDAQTVEGALMLTVPTGPYVVSAETWSPVRRRAGRTRSGVPARVAPPDIATLSDLLLLAPMSHEPASLEEAVPSALPRRVILPGQTFAIAWEVAGLGFRPETLEFEVSVSRDGVGLFGRIGRFLGLSEAPRPLGLSWQEPGPEEPRPLFRYLALDLPRLDEGHYEVELVLRTADRSDAVTRTGFDVRDRS